MLNKIFFNFKAINLITLLFLFSSFSFLNSAIEIKLETSGLDNLPNENMPTGYIGETFHIKVKVKNGGRNASEIKVNGLDRLNVEGTGSSTSISLINNVHESETTYIYDVNTEKEGIFEIGPAKIKRGGKSIKSNPAKINFKIIKRKGPSPTQNISGVSNTEDDFFCTVNVNKNRVVEGEPIILSFKGYSSRNVIQAGLPPFKLDDFSVKEIGQIKQSHQNINGKSYATLEKQFVLFPSTSGEKEIPALPAIYQVQNKHNKKRFGNMLDNDDFFQSFFQPRLQTKKVFSDNLKIQVDPLPVHNGKIDGIGEFTEFTASVDKNEAIINEPILLTLKIVGKGNLDQILTPRINLPPIFNTYESKTSVQEDYSEEYKPGSKQFEFVIQVNKPGEFKIEEQKFTYFDTISKQYKTIKTLPITLNIKQPLNKPSTNNFGSKETVNTEQTNNNLEKDINFIEEDINQINYQEESYISWWLFLFLIFIPISIYFKKSFEPITKFIKKRQNKKQAITQLKNELENIINKKEQNKIYSFFLNYIATKFDISLSLINQSWIENRLQKSGWEKDKINEFVNYLNECASITFAPTQGSKINYQQLLEKSKYWFLIFESNVL